MIGDTIFFKKDESSFISRIISKMTNSDFSHVGIIISYSEVNNVVTVIESDRFVNTRINLVTLNEDKHIIYTTGEKTEEQIEMILKYANDSIGVKYDYLQIFGLFLSLLFKRRESAWFNSTNKLICSELIDYSYYIGGIKRIDNKNIGNILPEELIAKYSMYKRVD